MHTLATWLAYFLVCVSTWLILRSMNLWIPSQQMQVTTLTVDEELPDKYLTREEGLARLDALIEEKRVPENCDDVMKFLKAFKKNKAAWGVTGQDLKDLYMAKCTYWELMLQWKRTCECCWDYRTYID